MKYREIYKCIVGSQAYGTATPESDKDYKGIYMQPNDDLLCFRYNEQVENGKDESYYEVRRFLQLLMSANPTVLEMLWMPDDCVLATSPEFQLIARHRDKFLTKRCHDSFGGYAVQQIKKAKGLDKKMNWENRGVERKGILDFCFIVTPLGTKPFKEWETYQIVGRRFDQMCLSKIDHSGEVFLLFVNPEHKGGFCDPERSNQVRVDSIPKELYPAATLIFNKDSYSRHCSDYLSYQEWLKNRNTQRFVDVKGHNQMIDGKNLLHCRRLLDMCIEIAAGRGIIVRRHNAAELLKIRKGEVDLQTIIDKAEEDIKWLKELFDNSDLPESVDMDFVNELLLEIRHYEQ